MSDLISREALRKAFHERIYYFDKSSWDEANAIIDNVPTIIKCGKTLDGLPLMDLRPKPLGEWKVDDTEQFCYCSNCEDTYYPRPLDPSWYYCPHCGAEMRGVE